MMPLSTQKRAVISHTFALSVFCAISAALLIPYFLNAYNIEKDSSAQYGIEGAGFGAAGIATGLLLHLLTKVLGTKCGTFTEVVLFLAALAGTGLATFDTVQAVGRDALTNTTNTTEVLPGLELLSNGTVIGNTTGVTPTVTVGAAVSATGFFAGVATGMALGAAIDCLTRVSPDQQTLNEAASVQNYGTLSTP